MNRLKNGQKVIIYNTGSIFDGMVCSISGVANGGVWGVGTVYIVKLPEDANIPGYQYSCMAMASDCFIPHNT